MTNRNKPIKTGNLWRNRKKHMIVQEESEEPFMYNGVEMTFRTMAAARSLLKELNKVYGEGEFLIRGYCEE